ncbi:MAG TPA: hypothetical protein VFF78_04930 [Anaerolineaceae bacterium]|nr:hypothetical protein [Anaerolineaceae bacterium]
MSPEITQEQFSNNIHTTFRVQGEEGVEYALELVSLQKFPPTPGIEQFSLLFQGAAALLLPQRTYTLAHEVLGSLDIFLVPVGISPDRAFYQYEAAFNRFTKEV